MAAKMHGRLRAEFALVELEQLVMVVRVAVMEKTAGTIDYGSKVFARVRGRVL